MEQIRALLKNDLKRIDRELSLFQTKDNKFYKELNSFINTGSKRIRSIFCLLFLKLKNIEKNENSKDKKHKANKKQNSAKKTNKYLDINDDKELKILKSGEKILQKDKNILEFPLFDDKLIFKDINKAYLEDEYSDNGSDSSEEKIKEGQNFLYRELNKSSIELQKYLSQNQNKLLLSRKIRFKNK